jgi:hypothetical protein
MARAGVAGAFFVPFAVRLFFFHFLFTNVENGLAKNSLNPIVNIFALPNFVFNCSAVHPINNI